MSGQRSAEDLDRELIELLNELRVALPGVQVLFAFLLAVPFANGWERVTDLQRDVFFLAELEQMTAPEIAEALGIRLTTVNSRLRVARIEFEEALARHRAREKEGQPCP